MLFFTVMQQDSQSQLSPGSNIHTVVKKKVISNCSMHTFSRIVEKFQDLEYRKESFFILSKDMAPFMQGSSYKISQSQTQKCSCDQSNFFYTSYNHFSLGKLVPNDQHTRLHMT